MQLPPFRLPESGDIVGDYRLTSRLGDGGQGLVFKAERAGRFFVIKFFRVRELDAWGLMEVSILQKFKHPNIVRVRGYDRWPDPDLGYFYIVMEWVDGLTLEEYVLTENPCARRSAGLMLTLARTLGAVHRKNVLHRDVKRDNILIRSRDGQPVLVDFGIGAMAETTPVPGSSLLPPGTQEYVSPEAWRFLGENVGEPVTYKSQVSDELWALGVTLYWLLANRLPFGTRRRPFLVKAILGLTPRAPHECNPRVPRALSDLCMRMLEKEPAARFPDMDALAATLESALAAARDDASWDVPLGDPDAPEETTTDELPAQVPWDEEELAVRKCLTPPRRGRKKPSTEESRTPIVAAPLVPEARSSPVPVAEALAARMAAVFPGHAWEGVPLPESAAAAPASAASIPPAGSQAGSARMSETAPKRRLWRRAASRAFPTFVGGLPARAVALDALRRAALVLGLMAVAAGASAGAVLAASPASDTGELARRHVAPEPPMPSGDNLTLHAYLARELAASRDSPQAGGGAAPFLPPTPAPELTTAMLRKEDVSVNTPDKPQPQARRARFAEKCVTAACCAVLGGCAGSPSVRPAPKPEACPDDAVATMKKLGIRIGQEAPGTFLQAVENSKPIPVNQFTTFMLTDHLGELSGGAVLSGRLIFAEGRVYGRFTQARQVRSKGGQTYPVCLELKYGRQRGVEIKRDTGPDSAVVFSSADVEAVDRFE